MVTYSLQSMPSLGLDRIVSQMNLIVKFLFRLQHQRQEGKANSELIQVLASIIGVRKSSVSIDHGHRSREKRVRLVDSGKGVSEILVGAKLFRTAHARNHVFRLTHEGASLSESSDVSTT